jgi:hypothetical protein
MKRIKNTFLRIKEMKPSERQKQTEAVNIRTNDEL